MWLFDGKVRPESAGDLVRNLTSAALELAVAASVDSANNVTSVPLPLRKASEIVDKYLRELKLILIGDAENDHDESRGIQIAAAAVAQADFAVALVGCLELLPLEVRKNAAHVFANLARRSDGAAFASVVAHDPVIIASLVNAYKESSADLALISGMMFHSVSKLLLIVESLLRQAKRGRQARGGFEVNSRRPYLLAFLYRFCATQEL